MSEVTRYLIQKTPIGTVMKKNSEGNWVDYGDFDRVTVERDAALAELKRYQSLCFEQDAPEELESLEADICVALKPAAQPQGEPVYQIEYLGDGGGGWHDVEKCQLDHLGALAHYNSRTLYTRQAEQPAPVAVVLPERDESIGTAERDEYANGYRHGWNAYHDAAQERLNPGAKP